MRLLVSGSTRTVRDLAGCYPSLLGHLLAPANRNSLASILATGLLWALDNGAFSGWNPVAFRRRLRGIAGAPRCLFVVCPDVVADARATLARFRGWLPEVRASGQPVAFVGQDGAEDSEIPWDDFDAWFIGGSTRWKLSRASEVLVNEARQRGKWVHMGRVNSLRRFTVAWDFGCDSVDGSSASMFGDRYIGKYCRWLRGLAMQPTLWRTL